MNVCAPLLICVIVFINVIQQCKSQAGPFNFLNYQPTDPSLQLQPDLPYPYPTGNQQAMGLLGSKQAFWELLRPIQPPLFTPNLMIIKNKLCELLSTNQLEVGPIMDYLVNFQHLDQFDLMITALLALRDTLPEDCPLSQEICQLIVHAIFRRCQARLIAENEAYVKPGPTISISTFVPSRPEVPQLSCETITILLQYFQSLFEQSNCQNCLLPNNNVGTIFSNLYQQFTQSTSKQAHQRRSIEVAQNNLLEKPPVPSNTKSIPFEQLIEMLPLPKNQIETVQYNTVKTFINSDEIKTYFKNISVSDYSNKQKFLNLVLNKVAHSSVDARIKEAFNFYLHYNNHTSTATREISFDYITLINLLPQPLDNDEKEKIEIIKSILSSKDIQKILKNIDASAYTDRKLLLKTVFQTILASKLDAKATEAFTYYLNYQESLTELELHTKKEITKHFELTKIFIDTLDIDSLSNDAKLAFRKFFKFISNITKEQIKNFDTWSEVNTKGEFMKALFKYLLSQSFVPQEVKESITKLEPLVKMVGRGAAPP